MPGKVCLWNSWANPTGGLRNLAPELIATGPWNYYTANVLPKIQAAVPSKYMAWHPHGRLDVGNDLEADSYLMFKLAFPHRVKSYNLQLKRVAEDMRTRGVEEIWAYTGKVTESKLVENGDDDVFGFEGTQWDRIPADTLARVVKRATLPYWGLGMHVVYDASAGEAVGSTADLVRQHTKTLRAPGFSVNTRAGTEPWPKASPLSCFAADPDAVAFVLVASVRQIVAVGWPGAESTNGWNAKNPANMQCKIAVLVDSLAQYNQAECIDYLQRGWDVYLSVPLANWTTIAPTLRGAVGGA